MNKFVTSYKWKTSGPWPWISRARPFPTFRAIISASAPSAATIEFAPGEGNEMCLGMRMNYGRVLSQHKGATLDDLREAVATLEEIEPIARRLLGSDHPITTGIVYHLQTLLRAREASRSPRGGS